MRVAGSLVWLLVVSLLACAGLTGGCMGRPDGYGSPSSAAETDETDPSDDTLTEDPITATDPARPGICPGECTPEPQIPFNGKIHLVWLGSAAAVPDCPAQAPLQGFEGYVVAMADMKGPPDPRDGGGLWVRECLISTDSATCEGGTTCAPAPPLDYRLCLSRESAGSCPPDHYPQQIVAQEWAASPPSAAVTLCCAGNAPPP